MAITNKQFDEYNRKLIRRIERLQQLTADIDNDELKEELREILDDLQKSIEA
ncbi:MAG: hypothetical protein NC253_06055 [Ruminococcus sp.]|nr:hypothetical protein [Ruminococcus sp.]MCM1381932.1 hypothetical protein [Muribaculaceae bacterium]MCM1480631.1 hypothetical protein [Muribaculaceae bacterium]